MSRADRFYLFATIFLAIAATAGGIMLAVQHSRNQPVEIVLSQKEPPVQTGELCISGAVANPGVYPLKEDDTLRALLSDAVLDPDADLSHMELYVPHEDEGQTPQKIDINRAERWLLEALPGIGDVLAQRIADYRSENGHFGRIEDLLQVSGIGEATFEDIKDLITVSG
jgi:competence protein ComEA